MADTVNDMRGPWEYRPHEHDDWGRVVGSDGLTICYAHVGRFSTEEQQSHREKGTDPAEPIAKLIAAAPDLLGALREIAGNGDGTGRNPQLMVDTAQAAIAKAEGRS